MGARITEKHAVFSAHAEVVPIGESQDLLTISILRARGGSSHFFSFLVKIYWYSPRTRR